MPVKSLGTNGNDQWWQCAGSSAGIYPVDTYGQVRGHRTCSSHSGAEEYPGGKVVYVLEFSAFTLKLLPIP